MTKNCRFQTHVGLCSNPVWVTYKCKPQPVTYPVRRGSHHEVHEGFDELARGEAPKTVLHYCGSSVNTEASHAHRGPTVSCTPTCLSKHATSRLQGPSVRYPYHLVYLITCPSFHFFVSSFICQHLVNAYSEPCLTKRGQQRY